MDIDRIRHQFPGRSIDYFRTVDSTMRTAAGRPAGYVAIAEEQTGGQGRHGHGWYSEPGSGIYCSMVLEPTPVLTLALGIAVADAIARAAGVACDLRWPNDLMLDGKKAGGILVQVSGSVAIAGIGINVNHDRFPADLSNVATSLKIHSDRPACATDILIELLHSVDRFAGRDKDSVLRMFARASSYASGRRVKVDQPDGVVEGTTAGLDQAGFLIVRKDDGTDTLIVAGGVRAAGS